MPDDIRPRKESEVQATSDPIPEEFDSPIAPQGYNPEFVEEIAELETPAQKRAKAVRYLIFTALLLVAGVYFCAPRNAKEELPNDILIPYGLDRRPLPPSDKFLYQVAPKTLGNYKQINHTVQHRVDKIFLGANQTNIFTYINPEGAVATVWIIDAESYINAKRFLKGYKEFLVTEANATVVDFIWQEHNFLEWEAPNLADRAYGFAWSNQNFYYSVTSASKEARDFFAQNFPY